MAIATTVGLSGAACSTSGQSSGGDGKTITVLAEDISYTDNIKALLPQFEKETGISVKIETVPYTDQASKILLNFSQKSSAYDVVFTDNVYGTGYYDSKYVEDLSKYEQSATSYNSFDKFYPPYIKPMTKDSVTFGLPVYGESTWLMYRKDLFEQYGIAKAPTTMEELLADAKTITEKSGGKVAGITLRGANGIQSVYPWSGFLRAFGGDYYGADGKIAVNSPQAVQATAFWADLLKKYGVKGVGNFDWEQNRIAFTQGKAAMTIDATANGPYNEDTKASVVAGKVGYAAVPYAIANPPATGNTNNSLNVHALYLSSFSKNKDAAYKFMAWATSEPVQANAVKTTESVGVTLTAVLQGADYRAKYGPFQDAVLKQLETGNVNYLPSGQSANTIITRVGQSLSQVLAGEQTAQAAMDAAQKDLSAQLK
ncbi:ABC transporter substrate-binding protein [Micromonospora olivasterospora]|nr:sugar ABC transporter substrate-binding protein [Micromonospora olivasterospora]